MKLEVWQKNLIATWISQFLSLAGFAIAMPLFPFYLQYIGVSNKQELNFWISIIAASTSLTLGIFSPVWGMIGDRYGRRLMLLRANIGAFFIYALMPFTTTPLQVCILRMMQGVFTGTVSAAQTMISAQAPPAKNGIVLGALSAAVFSGQLVGSFSGGVIAEYFGYRTAFAASSLLFLVSILVIFFGTTEVKSSIPMQTQALLNPIRNFTLLQPALPLFGLISFMAFTIEFVVPWLPLFVQKLNGNKLEGSALLMGILSAASGVAGVIAAPLFGRLADRITPPKVGKIAAAGASFANSMMSISWNFPLLACMRFSATAFASGLDPVFQVWLAKITPSQYRGFIFGWAVTAKALGWMLAPIVSGLIVGLFNIESCFIASAFFYLLLIVIINLVLHRLCI